jgi:hypothetical protein
MLLTQHEEDHGRQENLAKDSRRVSRERSCQDGACTSRSARRHPRRCSGSGRDHADGCADVRLPGKSRLVLGRGKTLRLLRHEPRPDLAPEGHRFLTGLFVLFKLGASIAPKLLHMPVVDETMAQLGWSPSYVPMIGLIELTCLVLYMIPRTSVLGAILMMGLLGGAMATQVRVGNPLFSHVLFSIYLGLFMWGGLWLRDPRLRALIPILREPSTPA